MKTDIEMQAYWIYENLTPIEKKLINDSLNIKSKIESEIVLITHLKDIILNKSENLFNAIKNGYCDSNSLPKIDTHKEREIVARALASLIQF